MNIKIIITNKIARAEKHEHLVCGNSDYIIDFTFDAEWDKYQTKTARFIFDDRSYTDVVFTGTLCPVPVLKNTHDVIVGVYAGDLKTTTPAYLHAQRSILCGEGAPADPDPDVYAQIMELLNKGGVTPEAVELAVKQYLDENPVQLDEADPTVPEWAKQKEKPKYTAEEVGAQPKGDYALISEIPEIPEIPAPYTLPTATKETLGGVKVGDGLKVDVDGRVSVKQEGVYELIETVTLAEDTAIERTQEPNGKPYAFLSVFLRFTAENLILPKGGNILFYGGSRYVGRCYLSSKMQSGTYYSIAEVKIDKGYWVNAFSDWQVNSSLVSLNNNDGYDYGMRYSINDYPAITLIKIPFVLPAGTKIEILGVRVNENQH